MSLTIPLNLQKIELENQLKQQRLQLGKLELKSLQRQQLIEKLSLIVDYAEASELNTIFERRLANNRLLFSYYNELRNSGKPNFESELEVNATITRIKDKLFANSIRLANIEQSLGTNIQQIPSFKISKIDLTSLNVAACNLVNLKLLRAKIELKIHEIEDKLLDFSSKASLSSSLTLSNFQENNGSNLKPRKHNSHYQYPCMMEGKALMRKHSNSDRNLSEKAKYQSLQKHNSQI